MKLRGIVSGVVAIAALAAGCGSGSLGSSGTAGTVGAGEGAAGGTGGADTAGTTGTAGTLGIAGALGTAGTGGTADAGGNGGATGGFGGVPACGDTTSGAADVVAMVITGSDDMPVAAPLTAMVTVTGIANCASLTCPPATGGATRYTLAGTTQGQSWMLYLRNTAMPPDTIKVGDMFDLTIDAATDQFLFRTVDQTIVLAREGNVMVLAVSLAHFFVSVPRLEAFGFAVIDEGAQCQYPAALGCILRPHAARVSASGSDASILLSDGQTKQIAGLSFTLGRFSENVDTGFCDTKSPTMLAAYRLP